MQHEYRSAHDNRRSDLIDSTTQWLIDSGLSSIYLEQYTNGINPDKVTCDLSASETTRYLNKHVDSEHYASIDTDTQIHGGVGVMTDTFDPSDSMASTDELLFLMEDLESPIIEGPLPLECLERFPVTEPTDRTDVETNEMKSLRYKHRFH